MTDQERATEWHNQHGGNAITALAAEFAAVRADERTRLQRCTKCRAALDIAEPYCINCRRPPGPR